MKSRATIRFVLDEEIVELKDVPPTQTVLEYLREVRGLTGTKEGCAEGDCGACTVVLGELGSGPLTHRLSRHQFLHPLLADDRWQRTRHGRGPAESRGPLHPVQQAMVDQHASQCGFCTPGFVMSLFGLYLNTQRRAGTTSSTRCPVTCAAAPATGPSSRRAARCRDYPQPAKWSRDDAQSATSHRTTAATCSPPRRSLGTRASARRRRSMSWLLLLESAPDSLLLAGGTDIGLWVTKHLRDLPPMIYIGDVAELQEIRDSRLAECESAPPSR